MKVSKVLIEQNKIEQKALSIKNEKKQRKFLTEYSIKWGSAAVEKAWILGDNLWTKYDEKF